MRYGLKAPMYLLKVEPSFSMRAEIANIASSCTPPPLPLVVWAPPGCCEAELCNIWSSDCMIVSDIWGASSVVTFFNTLCVTDDETNNISLRRGLIMWETLGKLRFWLDKRFYMYVVMQSSVTTVFLPQGLNIHAMSASAEPSIIHIFQLYLSKTWIFENHQ